MIETNIRIVRGGAELRLPARRAKITATQQRPDLLELACIRLRQRHHLAAAPEPGDPASLIVATKNPVPALRFNEDDWQLSVEDAGTCEPLEIASELGREVLPLIVERAVLDAINTRTQRWNVAGRPRHFYEPRAFETHDGISAWRRVATSAFLIEGVGIGVAVDTQTAFFAAQTLGWFFDPTVSPEEGKRRRRFFDQLARREHGHGTLHYLTRLTRSVCYFVEAPEGMTCGTTGIIRAKGQTFDSLFDYYQRTNAVTGIAPNDRAIRVSFDFGQHPVWVAAKQLRLSIFNDALPRRLENLIHMNPDVRRRATLAFWRELGESALGPAGITFEDDLWAPPPQNWWRISPPALRFGNGRELRPQNGVESYREYWQQRTPTLHDAGCFYAPPTLPRVIQCAYPDTVSEEAVRTLLKDLREWLRKWTGKHFDAIPAPYDRVENGIAHIQTLPQAGILLFIMNGERNAYQDISIELRERRPKHMDGRTLHEHFDKLQHGALDRRSGRYDHRRGRQMWDSFAGLLAIDLLQLHDGVPWATEASAFEAMLVIDVGYDRRHFGLSLLITRPDGREPHFRLATEIKTKGDIKRESINPEVLKEEILKLFRQVWPRKAPPLESLLVLRDGRFCGEERASVSEARNSLVSAGFLASNGKMDLVEFAKNTAMEVRMWDVADGGRVQNVPEGLGLEISRGCVILANTGRATLPQGTVEPVALTSDSINSNLRGSAQSCFFGAQLNWPQPRMAARLPLPLSRTDEELKKRAQEEARHTR